MLFVNAAPALAILYRAEVIVAGNFDRTSRRDTNGVVPGHLITGCVVKCPSCMYCLHQAHLASFSNPNTAAITDYSQIAKHIRSYLNLSKAWRTRIVDGTNFHWTE